MICAIIKNDIVENLIVINQAEISSLEEQLQCEIIDAKPYGLIAGDLRTPQGWTRNIDGEQIILPLLEQEQYDSYTIAVKQITKLQQENEVMNRNITDEIFSILNGGDEI